MIDSRSYNTYLLCDSTWLNGLGERLKIKGFEFNSHSPYLANSSFHTAHVHPAVMGILVEQNKNCVTDKNTRLESLYGDDFMSEGIQIPKGQITSTEFIKFLGL